MSVARHENRRGDDGGGLDLVLIVCLLLSPLAIGLLMQPPGGTLIRGFPDGLYG